MTQLTDRFVRAVDVARVLHATDGRKHKPIPYLSHLLGVTSLVLEHGGSEDQAIAAILHDAAEDHGGYRRLDAINAEFGPNVERLVHGLSDAFPSKGATKPPWLERKTAYLHHLRSIDVDVALISAADKVNNITTSIENHRHEGPAIWSMFNTRPDKADLAGKRDDTLWNFRRLSEEFTRKLGPIDTPSGALADRFRVLVETLINQIVATPAEHVTRPEIETAFELRLVAEAASGSASTDG